MVAKRSIGATIAGDGELADEDDAVLGGLDGERAQVEQLVVERAQRQPVRLDVWAADVDPGRPTVASPWRVGAIPGTSCSEGFRAPEIPRTVRLECPFL